MAKTKLSESEKMEKYKTIRERWDKEDNLLLTRMGIFLTTNSILLTALGFQSGTPFFQIGIGVVGIILSFLWLTVSWHSYNIIKNLYELSKDIMPFGLKKAIQIKPVLFRPNFVLCKLIPSFVVFGWLVFLFWKSIVLLVP